MAKTVEEVRAKLTAIIVEQLGVADSECTLEANFETDLGCDSLDEVELVMAVEESFNIEVPDEQLDQVRTVGAAIAYVHSKVHDKAATRK